METTDIYRALAQYEAQQWLRIWQSARTLTPAQFEQEIAYSHGSVRAQLYHASEVLERWQRGLEGDAEAQDWNMEPAEVATIEALQARHEQVLASFQAYVDGLSEEELAAPAPGMPGPRWQVLSHVINHGTDHRAQLLAALHQLDAPTFAQDLIFTLWFPRPSPWSKPLPGE